MPQWTTSPFLVTSSARLVSALVSSGGVSQEELEHASSSRRPVFSSRLHEAEQRLRMREELQRLQLEAALLEEEKKSADVTHAVHLSTRLQALQTFSAHLQDVLKDRNLLARRLARPPGRTDLPVPAHLRRFVVEVVHGVMDFVETLDEKRSAARRRAGAAEDDLEQLNACVAELSAQASEAETSANQLLRWKDARSGLLSDGSSS
ncbi:HAUS augmin-like complex subunit 2 [Phycodurus eques]|uniref:HAUS augmin-like complex subunit 2 n=1 Tax=Phycodurus eques TaxID=693459 RepID=UPI002ACDFC21|nr:HAUS augmin-like complex subunit 2 [Phycodurus eques]